MALKPPAPETYIVRFSKLRLWRDDLAEVVRIIKQLPDLRVRLGAAHNLLDDLDTDLPRTASRVLQGDRREGLARREYPTRSPAPSAR
jgi:hypothetical protein